MILRSIHLLAAAVWAGSMVFFSAVVMPALRQGLPPAQRQELIRILGRRYRILGWASVVILLITGPFMTWQQSAPGGVVWDSAFGRILGLKIALVGAMVSLTLLHDLVLGPRMLDAHNPHAGQVRQAVVWVARLNLLLVLAIILCGVGLSLN